MSLAVRECLEVADAVVAHRYFTVREIEVADAPIDSLAAPSRGEARPVFPIARQESVLCKGARPAVIVRDQRTGGHPGPEISVDTSPTEVKREHDHVATHPPTSGGSVVGAHLAPLRPNPHPCSSRRDPVLRSVATVADESDRKGGDAGEY